MRYFLGTVAFVLLIMQFVLIFDAIGYIGSVDPKTNLSGFALILINLIGVFFNVMTLRRSVCGGL
jgi:hypothetical protein